MVEWSDGYWWSSDGLRLHYRDYAGDASRPPIICIPGLTRNARDFEGVAERLGGRLAADLRRSARPRRERLCQGPDDLCAARPIWQDMEALIAELKLERFVLFGTSLGGLITMLLAASGKERIAGALLNDIGPVIESRGLEHIRSYVGRSQNWPTWLHAARYLAEAQRDRYPDWELDQWLVYAKRLCQADPDRARSSSTMTCASPSRSSCRRARPASTCGRAFRALAGIPSLVVHGEISDLLSAETVEKMKAEVPTMESVTVPRVGHAPTLEEPEAVAAIDQLLKRVVAKKR